MPENTYQKLAELIKKSPRLFGNGGLFGGINENHTVFNLFVDYLKKERRRNGHIPKTINGDNFINYLISEGTESEAEIAEINKKFQALKKEGQLNDQLANPQKNTLYNFALLLDEIGVLEGNPGQVTSRYNQALTESLQGSYDGATNSATIVRKTGKTDRAENANVIEVPNAETQELNTTEMEAQLQTRTETATPIISSGTGAETEAEAGTENEVVTSKEIGRQEKTPTEKTTKPASPTPVPPSTVNQSNNQEPTREITPPGGGVSETSYGLSAAQPTFFRDDIQAPTRESRGGQVFTGGFTGRTTRQKIRPIIEILSGRAGEKSTGRMISPGRRTTNEQGQAQTDDTQMQFEQAQRAQSADASGGFGRTEKRKSAGMRIAKITAGSSAIPISLLLLGGGSAKAAGFSFVTLILKFLF